MNFVCNFCKKIPELPAKSNSQYLSLHSLEWDESNLPMKINT
jgi:hypothetical protein